MPDTGVDDERIRAALRDLGERARAGVRPPGAAAIPAAARRRRAVLGGAAAALVALLGAGAWWAARGPQRPAHGPAAPVVCVPAEGRAFLRTDATAAERDRVGAALARSPEVTSYSFENREQAWARFQQQFADAPDLVAATRPENLPENWWFGLRCGSDFAAVRARIGPDALDLTCTCDPPDPKLVVTPSRR